MKAVTVRNVVIGEGIPKICVPIAQTTAEEILAEARIIHNLPADVVEWRVDWYEDVLDREKFLALLQAVREALKEIPLLVTFRTAAEGGEKAICAEDYAALNIAAAESGCADLIDVEAFIGDEVVKTILEGVHKAGAFVVASNHDFQKTPPQEELVRRLCRMQEQGADICKIAVMPQTKKDVLTLLSATEEMTSEYADRPIITMSMKNTGVISRVCGEVFGSALTFGAAKKASAPGQMGVEDLNTVLQLLHKAL